jgi:poly-beta-hydroxyalkanoate depolymerase
MNQKVEDPIVLKVMSKFYDRSQRGIEKYGTMLTRTDLYLTDWLNHLQEELMDATLYIEKLKSEVKFIAQKTGQGCACYGSNKIHECQCKQG